MGLDSVEMVLELEEAFEIRVPDEEAEHVRTINDLVEMVIRNLDPEEFPSRTGDEHLRLIVFEKTQRIVAGVLSIDPCRVTTTAHLIEDLGVD